MFKNTFFFLVLLMMIQNIELVAQKNNYQSDLKVGSSRFHHYLKLIRNKRVAVVANQGSVIYNMENKKLHHVVDSLKSLNINIIKVFSPEHGFRGNADAGENVGNSIDKKTNLTIISLHGVHKKPSTKHLQDIDIVLFDLQDVGVRFYTYISTLHYVMEACAQQNIPVIVLDRPNPNINCIDGPVLDKAFESFVGLHEVPIVYGMTIGEYAKMINGEGWLAGGIKCDLTIIPIQNYTRNSTYNIPIKPSPNLPNSHAINLYPSLCFFEGTMISCGRGTDYPFETFGSPKLPTSNYQHQFEPQPNFGSKHPKHQNKTCNGLDLRKHQPLKKLNLNWLIDCYKNYPDKANFFTNFFNTLAGNNSLKEQITLGYSEKDIRKTWQPKLEKFKKIRKKYLLYQ